MLGANNIVNADGRAAQLGVFYRFAVCEHFP